MVASAMTMAIVKVRFYFIEDLNVMPRLLLSRCVHVQYHHMVLWLVHRAIAFMLSSRFHPISFFFYSLDSCKAPIETLAASMFRRGDKLANSKRTHIVCDGVQRHQQHHSTNSRHNLLSVPLVISLFLQRLNRMQC